jgi:hypothetical protein
MGRLPKPAGSGDFVASRSVGDDIFCGNQDGSDFMLCHNPDTSFYNN